jgi:hypothetical protein
MTDLDRYGARNTAMKAAETRGGFQMSGKLRNTCCSRMT